MGSKLSTISCAPCRSKKSSRYQRRSIRDSSRRKYSSRRRGYDDSYYDTIRPSSNAIIRRVKRAPSRGSVSARSNHAMLHLASLSTGQTVEILPCRCRSTKTSVTLDDEQPLAGNFESNPLATTSGFSANEVRKPSADVTYQENAISEEDICIRRKRLRNPNLQLQPTKRSRLKEIAKEQANSRIGSSIEIIPCPELSSISFKSPQQNPGCDEAKPTPESSDVMRTPVDAPRIEDIVCQSRFCKCDVTGTTLTVPPNSLNSQFISGITPLGSNHENGFPSDLSSDSVFGDDSLDKENFVLENGQYYDVIPVYNQRYFPTIFCNNNNNNKQQSYYVEPAEKGLAADESDSSTRAEASEGPGFDSDFGASAGVEMRIVSSDNSGADSNPLVRIKTSAIKRWLPGKGGKVEKCVLKGFEGRSGMKVEAATGSVSRLFTHAGQRNRAPISHSVSRPRLATIADPEQASLHVTMEWDPYDTGTAYGAAQWMEYIIPGVTYPPYPLLSEKQYWV